MKIKYFLLTLTAASILGCASFTNDRQIFMDYRHVEKFWIYCTHCISFNCEDKNICERNMTEDSIADAFFLSIVNSDIDAVNFFIDTIHIDVNTILNKEYKHTALSVNANHPGPRAAKVTKILLDRGADINHMTGGPARSPVLRAIWKKNNPVARELIKRGADLSIKSDTGLSACIFAHRWSNFEIMPDLPDCCERISNIEASPKLPENRLRPSEFLRYCHK